MHWGKTQSYTHALETLQIILHWLNAIIIFSQDFFFWGTIFTQNIKKQEYIALILIDYSWS